MLKIIKQTLEFPDLQKGGIHSRDVEEMIIKKQKHDKAIFNLSCVDVDNLLFCVLCNTVFLNGIGVMIKSQGHFQTKYLKKSNCLF